MLVNTLMLTNETLL